MTRDLFFKVYANIPEDERGQVIAVIDGKTYTWNRAFDEIKSETNLGDKIIRKLQKMELI